jgi:hypothetical protein
VKRLACLFVCILLTVSTTSVLATSESPNYQLQQYSFGSGGTAPGTSSTNNKIFGAAGEIEGDPNSPNYIINGGLSGQTPANTPQTPTITNAFSNYDRLNFTLNPGSDPSDTTYAIAISYDNFATNTQYVSASLTLTNSLATGDWQTYTTWGGSSGATVSGLTANKTYTIKVKALQGDFSESTYSPTASANTILPSLTFSVSGSINLGNLSASNSFTSTANGTLTTSTNAYNGYNIYAYSTGPLTIQGGSSTIANYSGTYASPKSWASGTGFGYTTNDTDINNIAKWNATTCPGDGGSPLCYAAFNQTGPGDVVVDHETNLSTGTITNEAFTISYKIATTASQPAGTYNTTVIYTVAPIF